MSSRASFGQHLRVIALAVVLAATEFIVTATPVPATAAGARSRWRG